MARTKQKKMHGLSDLPWVAWAGMLTACGLVWGGLVFLRSCEDEHIKKIIDSKVEPLKQREDEDSTHRFWREPAVTRKLNEHDSFFRLEYPGTAITPIQTRKQ